MNSLFEAIIDQSKMKKTEKQRQVSQSAITLFAEKGYANTSTAEIAKHAGVSEGTIFKHYGTKEKLLLSIILPFVKEFLPKLAKEDVKKRLKNDSTVEEFLRNLIKDRIEFIKANQEIFQVIVKELIYQNELKHEFISYIVENTIPLIEPIIDKFKQKKEIPDLPNERILGVFSTALSGLLITRFVLLGHQTINETEIDDFVHFTINGIRNLQS